MCPQQALQVPQPCMKFKALRLPDHSVWVPTHWPSLRNDLRGGTDGISHKSNEFREKQLNQGGVPFSAAWSFQAVFGNESNSCLPWSSPKVAAAAWPRRHWFCSSSSSHLPEQLLLDVFTICTFFPEQENQDNTFFLSPYPYIQSTVENPFFF